MATGNGGRAAGKGQGPSAGGTDLRLPVDKQPVRTMGTGRGQGRRVPGRPPGDRCPGHTAGH